MTGMAGNEGLEKASTILLLVGAILSGIGAVFLLLLTFGMGALFAALDAEADAAVVLAVYGGLSLILSVGAILTFVAWNKARQGDWDGAFVLGLIGSLLPPVQIVQLLGAIFAKVSQDNA